MYKTAVATSYNHSNWRNRNTSDLTPKTEHPARFTSNIDYAVMERSKKIKMVSSQFGWSDLGSFESVYDYLVSIGHSVDENGNMVIGTDTYTAFIGVKDTIFVYTPTANLILKKECSQDVKSLYRKLEIKNSPLLD